MNDIHPIDDLIINRPEKEKMLNQKAKVIWLTGLSGAGKSTLGIALEKKLFEEGYLTQILDGDNIRNGINRNLKFTKADREENIRRIAEVNKLFINCGIITINCFISPTNEIRRNIRKILGKDNLIEIFVNTPLEICEKRDTKGLYKKARKGEIKNFTGIDSPFDIPDHFDIEIKTNEASLEESTEKLYDFVVKHIAFD